MKIDGEEVIEVGDEEKGSNDDENKGENENRNEMEDKKDRKEKEMCDSIIKELEKLEVGSGVRKSPLPPPLMTGTEPLRVSIMLLGDLNSTPETAVIEYFRTYVHSHTHANTHTHTRKHTHTHTHTHKNTHTHTCAYHRILYNLLLAVLWTRPLPLLPCPPPLSPSCTYAESYKK
jgi:ABC-type nickel/cobalt efflux system permease component RcnA